LRRDEVTTGFQALLDALRDALQGEARISDVRWYTKSEFEGLHLPR
jgi:hypothetical protein